MSDFHVNMTFNEPGDVDAEATVLHEGNVDDFDQFVIVGFNDNKMKCIVGCDLRLLLKSYKVLRKVVKETLEEAPEDVRRDAETLELLDSLNLPELEDDDDDEEF